MDLDKCTWVIEGKWKRHSLKDDEWVPDHDCNKQAVAIFSIRNTKKGPGEPKRLQYPRCTIHYTDAARAHAGITGYDIKELP